MFYRTRLAAMQVSSLVAHLEAEKTVRSRSLRYADSIAFLAKHRWKAVVLHPFILRCRSLIWAVLFAASTSSPSILESGVSETLVSVTEISDSNFMTGRVSTTLFSIPSISVGSGSKRSITSFE